MSKIKKKIKRRILSHRNGGVPTRSGCASRDTSHDCEPLAGRRSTALIRRCRPSAPRTRRHQSPFAISVRVIPIWPPTVFCRYAPERDLRHDTIPLRATPIGVRLWSLRCHPGD